MATQKGRNWSSGDIVTAANLSSIERGVSAVAENYTPTTWANGNTVTAAALNNIEQGIANAGGGSSDFSTAEVTLTAPGGNYYIPNIVTNGGVSALTNYYSPERAGTFILNVPMYKGISAILLDNYDFSVSGNAQKEGECVYITGDCTITI